MPIRDDLKQFYPDNWDDIRSLVLSRSRLRRFSALQCPDPHKGENRATSTAFVLGCVQCEWCGAHDAVYRYQDLWTPEEIAESRTEIGQTLFFDEKGNGTEVPFGPVDDEHRTEIVLTIAHLNHDPRDNSADNLAALCQRCHLGYDNSPEESARRRKVYSELLGQESIDGLSSLEVDE